MSLQITCLNTTGSVSRNMCDSVSLKLASDVGTKANKTDHETKACVMTDSLCIQEILLCGKMRSVLYTHSQTQPQHTHASYTHSRRAWNKLSLCVLLQNHGIVAFVASVKQTYPWNFLMISAKA